MPQDETAAKPTDAVVALTLVSLDNLEQLQDEWSAVVGQSEGSVTPSPPTLNSPRSLEACKRASIDPVVDLKKTTLKAVLMDTLQRVGGAEASLADMVQQRDPVIQVTAERARVLQLYPFSLRNVGSDDDKLRAYDRYQQQEGRRVSTIRMLKEIRQQLIAAEEFKMRKAHEAAFAQAQQASLVSPPKASRPKQQNPQLEEELPKRKVTGVRKEDTSRRLTTEAVAEKNSNRDNNTHSSQSRPSDNDSFVSLSSASSNEEGARPYVPRIKISNRKPQASQRPKAKGDEKVTAPVALTRKALITASPTTAKGRRTSPRSSNAPQAAVSSLASEEESDDEELFTHHSTFVAQECDDGVEFIHIVAGGPDPSAPARITDAHWNEIEIQKRQQKRKEAERLAAIERERKQAIIEEEERAFLRAKILRGRNLQRVIQTPLPPPQWRPEAVDVAPNPHSVPAIEAPKESNASTLPEGVRIHGAFNNSGGVAHSGDVVNSVNPTPRFPAASSIRSTPRSAVPADTSRSDSVLSESSKKRRELIEQAEAFRQQSAPPSKSPSVAPQEAHSTFVALDSVRSNHTNAELERVVAQSIERADQRPPPLPEVSNIILPSPLQSPERSTFERSAHQTDLNTSTDEVQSPTYDFSNASSRAHAVQQTRRHIDAQEYEASVASRMLSEQHREKRWEAIERAQRVKEIMTGRPTIYDRAEVADTVYF